MRVGLKIAKTRMELIDSTVTSSETLERGIEWCLGAMKGLTES